MFSFQVNFFVWILVDKLEFVWLKWKLQKYIEGQIKVKGFERYDLLNLALNFRF